MQKTILLALWFCGTLAYAATPENLEWPGWRGPQRSGSTKSRTPWKAAWPKGQIPKLWEADIGNGFGSFAADGTRVYALGKGEGNLDVLFALEAASGKPAWSRPLVKPQDEKRFKSVGLWGSCTTPWVDGAYVYAVSNWGTVGAYEAATGKVLWERDLTAEMEAGKSGYSYSYGSSPVVEGNVLIMALGKHGLGLDKLTGKTLWESGNGAGWHLSPVVFDYQGERAVLLMTTVVRAADGKVLAETPPREVFWTLIGPTYLDPCVAGNQFEFAFCLIEIADGKFKLAGKPDTRNIQFAHSVYSNPLHRDGSIYMSHCFEHKGVNTKMEHCGYRCRDFKTGTVKWEVKGDLVGSQLMVDDKILILNKNGELTIIEANPDKHVELARSGLLFGAFEDGKDGQQAVTCPAFAGGLVFLRKFGKVICLDLRTASQPAPAGK